MGLLKTSFSLIQRLMISTYNSKNVVLTRYAKHFDEMLPSKTPNKEEWDNIRKKLLNSKFLVMASDSLIMHLCACSSTVTAQSYYKYLKDSNHKIDLPVIGNYLEALSHLKPPLSPEQQKEIKQAYAELEKQNLHKSTATVVHCIRALCLTDDWMKAFDLLVDTDGYGFIESIYKCIISAALRNDKIDIVFELMEKSYILNLKLLDSESVHQECVEYMEQKGAQEHRKCTERMFSFWQKYNILPSTNILTKYLNSCSKFGWRVSRISMENEAFCRTCSGKLEELNISSNDYKLLKRIIVDNLFLFSKASTDPMSKELMSFRKFISRVEYYDVVIDGLNMILAHRNSKQKLGRLLIMIDYFKNKGNSVLVIGRKHLTKVPGFKDIYKNSCVFLVEDKTADDPFILYAALAIGSNTKFLSGDLMRTHCDKLPNVQLQRIFKLWQLSRQYVFNDDSLIVQHPVEFKPCALHQNGCWHIASSKAEIGTNAHDLVLHWNCAKPPLQEQ